MTARSGGSFYLDDVSVYCEASPPSVNLSILPTSGSENTSGTDITLTATASEAVSGDQTITIGLSGTAVAADFQSTPPTTITILDGQTVGNSTTFRVADDALNEGTQTATFTITGITSGGTAATIGTTDHVDFQIMDNDAPIISASGTLSAFSTNVGTASAFQSFTVSGDNLTGNLSVNAPTGYEVSLSSGSGYTTGTLTVPVTSGNVTGEPRDVFVRLTGAAVGSFSGNVAVSGGGATTVNVAAAGTVIDPNAATDLFISEYGEGSSGNSKYLEIYNNTGTSVDLANYRIEKVTNGGGAWNSGGNIPLSGTLVNNDVVVITQVTTDVPGGDITSAQVNWNGNDAVALSKNTGSWTVIDVIGVESVNPGTGWNVAGVTAATADHQLVRKSHVCGPNANWTSSAGTTTGNSEWIVTPYVTGAPATLGSHVGCTLTLPTVQVSLSSSTGSESTSTTDIVLTVTASAPVSGNQTVKVALTGTNVTTGDLTGFSSPVTVTILNGQTTGTMTFRVADDALTEATETAIFTLFDRSSGIELGTTIAANLTITDNDVPTSTASVIETQNGETLAISSLLTGNPVTTSNGVQVWRFRLYDGDGSSSDADGLPTIYTNWTITPSASNTVPDWDAVIQDRKFFLASDNSVISGGGITNPASILFPVASPFITVPDNGFVDVYLRITLKSTLPVGSDGKRFGFQIANGDVSVASSTTSSQLGSFTASSDGSKNVIDVAATLQFINAPTTVGLGDAFTITVSAIDANGNIDQDVTSAITLAQNSGTGTMSGGSTLNLVNGTRTWSGLAYDAEETFQVRATGGGYAAITANINVVDADYQLFDDFNRANSNAVGVPSSGGSTSWTEIGTTNDDGSRQSVNGGGLLLTGCNSDGTTGGQGMDQVLFNVENRYETVFDNADGIMTWMFNLKLNYGGSTSGWASNTYATAFILGCDQANVKNGTAKGYAVILGNSGSPDYIKIVRFGVGLTDAHTPIATSTSDNTANYYSVKVTFNPCNDQWSLYVRNDGTTAFSEPNSGTYGTAFTGTDNAHTSLDLKHFGAGWQHGGSCALTPNVIYDNFFIPNTPAAVADTKVWNGSAGTNWNTAANWGPCPGVPAITDNVVIPNLSNKPVVSGTPAAVCRSLTVNSGAELTINSNQNLTADNAVTNNGIIRVMNSGNFIQTTNSTSYSGSGSMVVQRQGTSSPTVYNYWGSPITNANVPGSNRYLYNSLVGTHSNADDNPADPGWQAYSGPMTPGRGYAATGAGLVTFTGTPNNADVPYAVTTSTQPMTSTVAGTRFNLVSNPYPSAISANAFINANGPAASLPTNRRIAGVLYFWDDDNSGSSGYSTSDYATWTTIGSVGGGGNTPQGSIASGQGFKVDAETSGNIVFTNAMRGGSNAQFFRLAEDDEFMDRLWLNISGSGNFNQTLVAFRDDATDLRDLMYDAYKVRGNAQMALGSVQANETFAVAAFPTLTSDRVVPLLTYVAQQGTYTFEADSVDGFEGFTIYLEDLLSGQLHAMEQGTTVAVQMGPEHEYGRFQLRFSPELVTGVNDAAGVMGRIIASEQGIRVMMGTDVSTTGDLLLYSLSGQLVSSRRLGVVAGTSDRLDVSGIPLGVYLAEFRSETGVINAKVMLQ